MEQQHDLAKWLAGEMSDSELSEFKKTDDYKLYQKIADHSVNFDVPTFDDKQQYQQLLQRQQQQLKVGPNSNRILLKVAAILILTLGGYFLLKPYSSKTELAQNGSTTSFELPDKSFVKLNSGSDISYNNLDWENERTVKLDGEAYFEVAKGKKFQVSTSIGKVAV
ncbi:MAG TPA: FecR family protein, partial [Flavobacterium sp.]|nr:FecR family protein [Flavobacterium sp.]